MSAHNVFQHHLVLDRSPHASVGLLKTEQDQIKPTLLCDLSVLAIVVSNYPDMDDPELQAFLAQNDMEADVGQVNVNCMEMLLILTAKMCIRSAEP